MHKKWHPPKKAPPSLQSPASKRKKLRLVEQQTNKQLTQEGVLDGVFHELRNCLQSISVGVDLLQIDRPETVESRTIALGIERASRLLREIHEYCFPSEPHLSMRTLKEVLKDTIHALEREGQGARIQLYYPEILPPFQYDWLVLERVLERVFRCACGVLPSKEGEVLVNVRAHNGRTRMVVEIQVEIYGGSELEIDEDRIFTPFWRVDDYQVGLGLVLARRAMQSRKGQLTFEKTSPHHAHFSLLLDVLPEAIASVEARPEEDHVYVE